MTEMASKKRCLSFDLKLVFGANDSMMSTRHVGGCLGASILLDIQTARQWLQRAIYDTN